MNTLEMIAARFGALLTPAQALEFLGRTPRRPSKAATESISRGDFPFATIKIGRARYVRAADVASRIDGAAQHDTQVATAHRGRPGRPRKTHSVAPQQRGGK